MTSHSRRVLLSSFLLAASACIHVAPELPAQAPDPTALQKEVLAKISGESEIRPGVKLANRFTPENRQETRAYLTVVLKRLGLTAQTHAYGTAGGVNVYAVLSCGKPGASSIIVGAHYDTVRVAPGANDDGSGVAAVIGIARELTKVKSRQHDIIFAFFDEEERGLVGSKAFAQMLKDQNKPIATVHTIDQMGWDSNHNRAIELEESYEGAEDLYKRAALALKMDIPIFTTTDTSSDHASFTRLGYQAVGITEEYHHKDTTPYYHKAGDTYETIDFDYLASTTRLMVEVLRMLVTQA